MIALLAYIGRARFSLSEVGFAGAFMWALGSSNYGLAAFNWVVGVIVSIILEGVIQYHDAKATNEATGTDDWRDVQ